MLNALPEEERAHGTISNKTYLKYIREGANTTLTVLLIVAFIAAEVTLILRLPAGMGKGRIWDLILHSLLYLT